MASSSQLLATMEKLPNDILSNIFIRLLAKQLAQMRCLSKTWNDLLSRPSFIKSHLNRSLQKNDEILLVFYGLFSFHSKPFTAHPTRSPHIQLTNFIKLPKDLQSERTNGDGYGSDVIGSVNGLICFKYGPYIDGDYYIWNPSLSALLTLPPSDMPYYESHELNDICLGFGYDPTTDDYKFVKLTSINDERNMEPDPEWLVEVFSMRKGFFQLITQRPPSYIKSLRYNHQGYEVRIDGHDGHVHWFGYTDSGETPVLILAFDLGAETFCEIRIPDLLLDKKFYFCLSLGVSVGKLCIMAKCGSGECEVWVMNEYGMDDSWVKHLVLPKCLKPVASFGLTLHNEFLYSYFPDRLALYDSIAAKVKHSKLNLRNLVEL